MTAHTTTNANAYDGCLDMTNDAFQAFGIILPNGADSRVNLFLASPIPTNINATPAGIFRLEWIPMSTGNFKIFLDLDDCVPDTTQMDITAGALTTNVTEAAVTGAGVLQVTDISLTSIAASLVSGSGLFGWLERKASSDASDTVEAPIALMRAYFVANT